MADVMRGSCYCGAIRFEANAPSKWVAHCHCVNCRRAHGAGVVTWAGFLAKQVELHDDGGRLSRYVTDTGATRSFCGRCGTPLFYEGPRWPDQIHVAVGAFDDPPDRAPQAHVFSDRAPEWLPILDDIQRLGGDSGTEPL
jgi:hypothetical protein